MNLSLNSPRNNFSHVKSWGIAALGLLTAVQVAAAAGKVPSISTNKTVPTPMQRRAMQAAMREAHAKYASDTNAPFVAVTFISSIASNPSLPPRVKTALSNPEVVAEIQACAHDNARIAKHFEKPTSILSVQVVSTLQFMLNTWHKSWATFHYDQTQRGIRDEAANILKFSGATDPWPAGVAHALTNTMAFRKMSEQVLSSIAPGGPRAALAIDGDAQRKTLLSLQYFLADLSRGSSPRGSGIVGSEQPAQLSQYTLHNARSGVIIALCNNLATEYPELANAIAPFSLDARVNAAAAEALRSSAPHFASSGK